MPKSSSNASHIQRSISLGEEWGIFGNFTYECPYGIKKVYKSKKAQDIALRLHKRKCELCNSSSLVYLDQKFNRQDVSGNKMPTYSEPK